MTLINTPQKYGKLTILLHWLMALLIIGLIVIGLWMTRMPLSLEKVRFYGWHKEWGMLALALVIVRLGWRFTNTTPSLLHNVADWQLLAARAMHWAFYGFMFAMPISGWMMSSAAGLPVSVFGWFVLPNLVPANENLRLILTGIHEWLGYGLIIAICGHVGASLWHHFIHKDDILRRMLS